MRKLKFYFIGLLPGLAIMFFFLNKKGASCSGYLPSSRVVLETLSKEFEYSNAFTKEMKALKIDDHYLRDSIINKGEINFEKSKAQKQPCPYYILVAPMNHSTFEVVFEKCQNKARFIHIKKLQ